MPEYGFLAFGLMVVLVGLLLVRRGVVLARVIRDTRALTTQSPDDLTVGLVRTHGRLDAEAPEPAALTGRPSVYYFVKAEDVPPAGGRVRRLATIKRWVPAQIVTDQARVELEPWTPLVASAHQDHVRFEGLDRVPEDRQDLFEALGMADRHVARLGAIDVTEYRFEPGDEAYVTGTFEPEKGLYRHQRNPYVVSTSPDVGYLKGLRHELLLYFALPPMLLAAGLVLLVLAFA